MSATRAIAMREYAAFFRLPVGWVVIALFLFLTGLLFLIVVMRPGEPATLRGLFAVSGWLMLPIAPAISMRLVSEELRSGTIEPLMTSPVSDASIVIGKYLGACLFLLTLLAPTAVYVFILYRVADPAPDPGPILAGYLSVLLVGLLYTAVGTFASALTGNQTLAFIGTLLTLLIVLLITSLGFDRAPAAAREVLAQVSIPRRVGDFAKGVVDTANIAFFVGGSVLFLALAVVAVESRRWR
jgi:ABC-2 type transport system permease protein